VPDRGERDRPLTSGVPAGPSGPARAHGRRAAGSRPAAGDRGPGGEARQATTPTLPDPRDLFVRMARTLPTPDAGADAPDEAGLVAGFVWDAVARRVRARCLELPIAAPTSAPGHARRAVALVVSLPRVHPASTALLGCRPSADERPARAHRGVAGARARLAAHVRDVLAVSCVVPGASFFWFSVARRPGSPPVPLAAVRRLVRVALACGVADAAPSGLVAAFAPERMRDDAARAFLRAVDRLAAAAAEPPLDAVLTVPRFAGVLRERSLPDAAGVGHVLAVGIGGGIGGARRDGLADLAGRACAGAIDAAHAAFEARLCPEALDVCRRTDRPTCLSYALLSSSFSQFASFAHMVAQCAHNASQALRDFVPANPVRCMPVTG